MNTKDAQAVANFSGKLGQVAGLEEAAAIADKKVKQYTHSAVQARTARESERLGMASLAAQAIAAQIRARIAEIKATSLTNEDA